MTTPMYPDKTEHEEATHKEGMKDPKTANRAAQKPRHTQRSGPTFGAKAVVAKAVKIRGAVVMNEPAVTSPLADKQKKPQVTAGNSVPTKEYLAKKRPVFARLLEDEKQRESGESRRKTAQTRNRAPEKTTSCPR
jgi:hypothetical protein